MIKRTISRIIALIIVCTIMFVTSCGFCSPLDKMKRSLNDDFSFTIEYLYMDIANNGMSQKMKQVSSKNGSFSFLIDRKNWNHNYNYENSEIVEYYYQYEGDTLYCYMKDKNQKVSKVAMSDHDAYIMKQDKNRMVSSNAIFPSYLEGLKESADKKGYEFTLPTDKLLKDNSYLSVFLQNAFNLSGKEYDSSLSLNVKCTIEVEENTYRINKISYDFSQLKELLLSEFSLEAEKTMGTELMYMVFELDYDLADKIIVPNDFLVE